MQEFCEEHSSVFIIQVTDDTKSVLVFDASGKLSFEQIDKDTENLAIKVMSHNKYVGEWKTCDLRVYKLSR